MLASILLLPLELKRLIVEQSSGSPSSLAALALTHTSYQREAEKALYEGLSITAYRNDSLKCIKTLATNPDKAALVRFLTIEYTHVNPATNRRITTYLNKSLINMHSLSDIRIRSPPGDNAKMKKRGKRLGKILCEGHFRLKALYCNDVLDIPQIIKSQTELQILGLYSSGGRRIAEVLKELHSAQLFLPIVLTLKREGFSAHPYHISIFPVFYSVERCATIHQALTQSFSRDRVHRAGYMVANVDNICELSIYLIDSSDIPSIYALAKKMAVSFPQIGDLNLRFERGCEITLQEIKEKFSFFSNLCAVNITVWR